MGADDFLAEHLIEFRPPWATPFRIVAIYWAFLALTAALLIARYPSGSGHLLSRVSLNDSGLRGTRWKKGNSRAVSRGRTGSRHVGDGGARRMRELGCPRLGQAGSRLAGSPESMGLR
jgi:hypothetical protein